MKCFKCVPQFAKKMDIFRTFILLNLFLQFSEGFSWLSSSVNSSSCEGKNINITWEYNLDTSESADTAQWRKDNGVGGTISVATFFSGTFYEASNYIGRLNRIGNAGLEIKNARYMDSGIYYYFVTLNTGITNSSNATVSVYVIPNTSCMPVTEKSNRNIFTCKIHDACPGRNSIQARWDDGSVGVLTCLSATKHKCCAEGTSVTNCYNGSLCTEIECEASMTTTETEKTQTRLPLTITSQANKSSTDNQLETSPSTTTSKPNEIVRDNEQIVLISVSVSIGVIVLGVIVTISCRFNRRRRVQKKSIDEVDRVKDRHRTPHDLSESCDATITSQDDSYL